MTTGQVSDMTLDDLRSLIRSIVEEYVESTEPQGSRPPVEEVLRSMRENLWTPPPGAKSSLEMLREDRDR
jgi:hypothetical protein